MTIALHAPKLAAFLEALPRAEENALCSPPGLGGLWRVRHIRSGMGRGVLCVHHSGQILCYAPLPTKHGCCQNCQGRKAICDHCNCTTCVWDRETDERSGPRITREQAERLRAKVMLLNIGVGRKPVLALDGDL